MEADNDPNLKQAMAEISAICQHYGVGAAVALVSPMHAEWAYRMPPWGRVSFTDGGIRIRAARTEFPSREAHRQAVELTAHLILQLRDMGYQFYREMAALADLLAEQVKIEHTPYGGEDQSRLRPKGH